MCVGGLIVVVDCQRPCCVYKLILRIDVNLKWSSKSVGEIVKGKLLSMCESMEMEKGTCIIRTHRNYEERKNGKWINPNQRLYREMSLCHKKRSISSIYLLMPACQHLLTLNSIGKV